MISSEKVPDLLKEGFEAQSFCARSLFYANRGLENSPLAAYLQFDAGTAQLYQEFKQGAAGIATAETHCADFISDLNGAYFASLALLQERFISVYDLYWQYAGRRWRFFRIADRNGIFTRDCAHDLVDRSRAILDDVTLKLITGDPNTQKIPSREWAVVRSNGLLLMEEITFLVGRTDYLINLYNWAKGFAFGFAALILPILVTLGLRLCDHYGVFFSKPANATPQSRVAPASLPPAASSP